MKPRPGCICCCNALLIVLYIYGIKSGEVLSRPVARYDQLYQDTVTEASICNVSGPIGDENKTPGLLKL